jgi:hypothetical protein
MREHDLSCRVTVASPAFSLSQKIATMEQDHMPQLLSRVTRPGAVQPAILPLQPSTRPLLLLLLLLRQRSTRLPLQRARVLQQALSSGSAAWSCLLSYQTIGSRFMVVAQHITDFASSHCRPAQPAAAQDALQPLQHVQDKANAEAGSHLSTGVTRESETGSAVPEVRKCAPFFTSSFCSPRHAVASHRPGTSTHTPGAGGPAGHQQLIAHSAVPSSLAPCQHPTCARRQSRAALIGKVAPDAAHAYRKELVRNLRRYPGPTPPRSLLRRLLPHAVGEGEDQSAPAESYFSSIQYARVKEPLSTQARAPHTFCFRFVRIMTCMW